MDFVLWKSFVASFSDLLQRDARTAQHVLDKTEKFEREYRATLVDTQISRGFDLKQIDLLAGEYQLKQVELTVNFRAAILFPHGHDEAFWLDFWKKTKLNNRHEVRTAQSRAFHAWEDIKGDYE